MKKVDLYSHHDKEKPIYTFESQEVSERFLKEARKLSEEGVEKLAVEYMKNFIERNYKNDDNYSVKGITMGEEGEFRYVEVDFSKEGNPEDVEKFSYHKRYKITENKSTD